ncbi:MAG: hemolysin family protein [Cyclobacteriaceae bacterium]
MDYYAIVMVLICLLFSAFFSGIEIAFISADKLRIELAGKQGVLSGRLLSNFMSKPSRFIGTTLVGNNIALVLYSIFMAKLLDPWLSQQLPAALNNDITILVVQTILATILVLTVAEFTPKSAFLIDPNGLLSAFAVPMTIIYYVMYPIVWVIDQVSQLIIRYVLGFRYREDKPVFGLTDLNNYVKNILSEDILQQSSHRNVQLSNPRIDAKIFSNAIEFKTVKVRECMIPRTEVVAVDIEDDIEELRDAFMQSGHSKIIVYKETIDDVIGYCHSLELFKKPKSVSQILTPIIIVPETIPANELMIQFITEHKSLALVVDEFGGTAGIVSMEDIIEEIFGDIQDEHDVEDWVEMQIDSHNFLISARHEIDYLNEKFNWVIPSGDYDTLGGYILSITGEIPSTGNVINVHPFTFTIMSMRENRIDNVKVTVEHQKTGT